MMCGGQKEKRKAWGEWSVGEEGEEGEEGESVLPTKMMCGGQTEKRKAWGQCLWEKREKGESVRCSGGEEECFEGGG
ncbi:hypothetical protein DEO72_LG9g2890 [Vigna unguiculata]|uniref:Uncharacterized protein n=1 Tax=Vigna unguiculata TaxID=3917 RepID=A0A4D6KN07_VIGUN|nr:hypothetical protein DEO72_LG1g2675 [Vigna unguiculata]QCE07869.1 hypothetical protein DEO72_LG9g2890 [Vigna unguiculata]